jgi:hypothetical protein
MIILVISDFTAFKKENISLRNLAFLLYEEGDIDRGMFIYSTLLRRCFVLVNARLRTYEISKMLPHY